MSLILNNKLIGKNLICLPTIGSTNLFIKQHINSLPNGFLAFTTNQTNGYGTKNRTWHDFENKSLAFSILLKNISHTFLEQSTQFTAVTIIECLKTLHISNAKIKWFNDILIKNKKIAGILGESQIIANKINLILGIGINLLQSQRDFQKFNLHNAGSILSQTGKTIYYKLFLKLFINIFEYNFFSHLKNVFPTFELYKKYCNAPSKNVNAINLSNKSNQNLFYTLKLK